MAASADTGNNREATPATAAQNKNSSSSTKAANGVSTSNNGGGGNCNSGDNSQTMAALKHNPGLAVEWTLQEQSILDDLINKYSSETTIVRYAKIAMQLKDKTVRDVVLRCRWMTKKESSKRRKEDQNSARKHRDRKDSSAKPSSHLTAPRPNGPSYAPPLIPMESDDVISCKDIGGVTGELFEQNAQMLYQISANFASLQIPENITLLFKTRENILTILNDLNEVPEIMKQMPHLPVKINEELAKAVLHIPSNQMQS